MNQAAKEQTKYVGSQANQANQANQAMNQLNKQTKQATSKPSKQTQTDTKSEPTSQDTAKHDAKPRPTPTLQTSVSR